MEKNNVFGISRVRHPRVRITYAVEIADAIENKELPFVVGVLGDFIGQPTEPPELLRSRQFVTLTRDNFDDFLRQLKPHLSYAVANRLTGDSNAGEITVDLNFSRLEDFHPVQVARQIEPLRQLLESRTRLQDLSARLQGNGNLENLLIDIAKDPERLEILRTELNSFVSEPNSTITDSSHRDGHESPQKLLSKILDQGRFAKDENSRRHGRELVEEFVARVARGAGPITGDLDTLLNTRIEEMDSLISRQLDEVLHTPTFQQLEASWHGLQYLVDCTEMSEILKIKVIHVSKKELYRDLQRAPEFDESVLFKKVYEEEFGTLGGEPFGVLLGDYEFGRNSEDVDLLEKIAQVASSAHAPFLSAASPDLFNLDNFGDLRFVRSVRRIFEATDYAMWRLFRQSEDSRYVVLCLPHVLLRSPYGMNGKKVETFNYQEGLDRINCYLWGNPAYALAARLTGSFAKFGWCAAIQGVESGGIVEGLPTYPSVINSDDTAPRSPTDAEISDRREQELSALGFTALAHYKNAQKAVFFSIPTCWKPPIYDTETANLNAHLSTQLSYILAASRFAHYIKAMVRDKIGSFISRLDCERFLNNWISQYICVDDDATQSVKAELPIREAQIDVSDVPGKPGVYRAVAFLRPHFQMDPPTIALRQVMELPAAARR